ncbi:MAG: hypothetical protein PVG39_31275 [Desulfobacteraceae bacterium]|jgi:hypothetical protein
MNFFSQKYYGYLFWLLTVCLLISGCFSKKEFRFTFNRKDGETYIQRLSISRERHTGPTNIQMEDILSVTRVTCKKTEDGWDINSRPVSRVMMKNGKEVKNPLLALLSEFVITYKLNRDGDLEDIIGYEKMAETFKSRYPDKLVEGLPSLIDIDAIKRREFSEWNGRIGNFLNREFSIGEVWESETPFTLPNGVELTYRVKTRFKEQVQHKNIRYILIEQTYDSTGEGIADLMNDVAESVSAETDKKQDVMPRVRSKGSSIKGKVTRIIDPSTMNIYKEDIERTIIMEMDLPGAGHIPVKMIETRSYEYEY